MAGWIERIASYFESPSIPKISVSDEGLLVAHTFRSWLSRKTRIEQHRVLWENIEKVTLRKLDCYTYDTIGMEILLTGGRHLWIDEDYQDVFIEILGALSGALPCIADPYKCFLDVCGAPAFQDNPVVVFERR